jgi:NDP-sugar pyrophosphorylase family protein
MEAIILAGGLGTRLRPYTDVIPKPLLPLDGTPILEILLRQLAAHDVDVVTLALHYKADQIRTLVGDGDDLGVRVEYSVADRLLGTAGPLGLIDRPAEPCLVLNADLLTNLDYREVMDHHRRSGAAATMVLFPYRTDVPFGVIDVDGRGAVAGFREKPTIEADINAGVYVLDPLVWDKIPPGEHLQMNNLIERALAKDRMIAAYRHQGDWLDVGTVDSFHRGDEIFRAHRDRYLPHAGQAGQASRAGQAGQAGRHDRGNGRGRAHALTAGSRR